MRILIVSLIITSGFFVTGTVRAQPAQLSAPATETPALPDLTPDVITKPGNGYQAPANPLNEGESVIAPSQEPWQKEKAKRKGGKTADEVFATLPTEIQSQILDETHSVHNQCTQYKIYAQLHNCECLGSRYFEERVFSPEQSKDTIVGAISGECTSVPGVAGYGFDQCIAAMRYVVHETHMSAFCNCFANTLAENYQRSPWPDFENLRALTSKSNATCLKKVPGAIIGLP